MIETAQRSFPDEAISRRDGQTVVIDVEEIPVDLELEQLTSSQGPQPSIDELAARVGGYRSLRNFSAIVYAGGIGLCAVTLTALLAGAKADADTISTGLAGGLVILMGSTISLLHANDKLAQLNQQIADIQQPDNS
ncbi:MAG TPA: hypothetical protein VMR77_03540 [Patescibacteria group bacterium]|jgi:hypothetical protein|nr:hypothetical protein [Patescibacteria group bacterium]